MSLVKAWHTDYLVSIGFNPQAIEGFWDRRYISSRMAKQIRKTTYIGCSRFSGWGMFARKQLRRSTVVGYFAGPTLNSKTWANADPNFISYARWVHPWSEKSHSYYFEVVSPSRYMNGGIHPRDLEGGSKHPMKANVGLLQDNLKINNRHRPVLVLTTLHQIDSDEELLLDYGVLDDIVYYEYLRREKRDPSIQSERAFQVFLNRRYRKWPGKSGSQSANVAKNKKKFINEFATFYFNQPDQDDQASTDGSSARSVDHAR